MSSPSKRREMDLMKLMMGDYKVEMINDGMQEFYVDFNGPPDSPYHGGVWRIRVELPDAYPYKSPSIGFVNKIYHPNVDEQALVGSTAISVTGGFVTAGNEDFDTDFGKVLDRGLVRSSPRVQGELKINVLIGKTAGSTYPENRVIVPAMKKRDFTFEKEEGATQYCEKYAKPEHIGAAADEKSSDEELSEDDNDYASSDEAVAGHPDP
ncbi:hypothetical protein GIB67_037271 [Kingdonia uniflora]|uniref:UBC core domain-containing protein n=1 Tax=Kingdonia uniflora TaxID=39325 RepID=A0A7J7MSM7_9MAGN|nr:hypothetical protein GIB67_037271 [Kingdonia uniflora]